MTESAPHAQGPLAMQPTAAASITRCTGKPDSGNSYFNVIVASAAGFLELQPRLSAFLSTCAYCDRSMLSS